MSLDESVIVRRFWHSWWDVFDVCFSLFENLSRVLFFFFRFSFISFRVLNSLNSVTVDFFLGVSLYFPIFCLQVFYWKLCLFPFVHAVFHHLKWGHQLISSLHQPTLWLLSARLQPYIPGWFQSDTAILSPKAENMR